MRVELGVNGRQHSVEVEPRRLLVDTLRDDLGLTGTTVGCGHGVCGSCTVLVDGEARRSCLTLTVQCQGSEVTTVEGLATPDGDLHPLQLAFHENHALQCGFCTPGFLMLLAGALDQEPDLDADPERLTGVLASNLCRCTGYVAIEAATRQAAAALRARRQGPAGGGTP
jgi:carbon-monoxide dehydrogenase small subunit